MDALLLALLLNIALDQGSGAQRLAARLGDEGAIPSLLLWGLPLAVVLTAVISAAMGAGVAALLIPEARLLFLAMALAIGGCGMIAGALRARDKKGDAPRQGLHVIGQYALRRAGENAAFATAGVAAFTNAPILAAAGATLGGCVALALPLSLGAAPLKHGAMLGVRALIGLALASAAIGCGATALRLL